MATKTYFGFESQLKSKELTEAIALQQGPGPLFGYGGFTISGTDIILTPTPNAGDTQLKEFRDKFNKLIESKMSQRVMIQALGDEVSNFGIVSKDGYVEVNSDNNITIPISNTQSTYPEIIVIARHAYSEDVNVEMPILYEAYWNQSSVSFFKLYKKAIDYKYPTSLGSRVIKSLDEDADPQDDTELSYSYLESTALAATGLSASNTDDVVLVGIYGTGNDMMSETGTLQKFIIVPYERKFPMPLTYSWADVNHNKDLLRYMYKIFEGMGDLSFRDYLKKILSESDEKTETVSVSLPVGTIIMWYGSTSTIPYGWELCDGTASVHNPSITKPNLMGKFPIGLSTNDSEYKTPAVTGGNNSLTLEINNIPKHTHVYTGDDGANGKFGSVEAGFPKPYVASDVNQEVVTGTAGSAGNQGVARAYLSSTVGGNKPIDNRPAFTVVAFIIKTLE
jgi:microcystin-dependent protein